MKKVNWLDIEINVDQHKCPGAYWCVQATTYYEPHEAEHMCLRCWQDYYRKNGYEIDYTFDEEKWKEHLTYENKA